MSKLAIENYLAVYKNIEGISLRPGNPYGSYQLRGTTIGLIANFLSAVCENRNLEVWGDGSVVRGYDVPKIILDTEKFRSETGWMARTSLEEGILKLWEKLL